jgi:hypothetical protein
MYVRARAGRDADVSTLNLGKERHVAESSRRYVLGAGHASTLKGPIQRGESSKRDGRGACSVSRITSSLTGTAKRTSRRCVSNSALRRSCRSCSSASTSVVMCPIRSSPAKEHTQHSTLAMSGSSSARSGMQPGPEGACEARVAVRHQHVRAARAVPAAPRCGSQADATKLLAAVSEVAVLKPVGMSQTWPVRRSMCTYRKL